MAGVNKHEIRTKLILKHFEKENYYVFVRKDKHDAWSLPSNSVARGKSVEGTAGSVLSSVSYKFSLLFTAISRFLLRICVIIPYVLICKIIRKSACNLFVQLYNCLYTILYESKYWINILCANIGKLNTICTQDLSMQLQITFYKSKVSVAI